MTDTHQIRLNIEQSPTAGVLRLVVLEQLPDHDPKWVVTGLHEVTRDNAREVVRSIIEGNTVLEVTSIGATATMFGTDLEWVEDETWRIIGEVMGQEWVWNTNDETREAVIGRLTQLIEELGEELVGQLTDEEAFYYRDQLADMFEEALDRVFT